MCKQCVWLFIWSPLFSPCTEPPVFLLHSFLVHPFPNVERAVDDFDASSATGIQKPTRIDIDEIQFVQIQSYRSAATLDLSVQIVELLISKFTTELNSSAASDRNAFHFQRHLRTASAVRKCK